MPKPVDEVLARNEAKLMAIPGVEGIGIGGTARRPEIIVMVREGLTAMQKKLPASIEGYPVRVEISGEISAL